MTGFDGRDGTRGGRRPTGRMSLWFNRYAAGRIKKGRRVGSEDILVLSTVGKKTGEHRENPVGWFAGPDGSWFIVAAAAGAAKNPSWYYNIAAHPDQVSITLEGRTTRVTPRQLHGTERDAAWRQIVARSPGFAKYETSTDRDIPVLQLTASEGQ